MSFKEFVTPDEAYDELVLYVNMIDFTVEDLFCHELAFLHDDGKILAIRVFYDKSVFAYIKDSVDDYQKVVDSKSIWIQDVPVEKTYATSLETLHETFFYFEFDKGTMKFERARVINKEKSDANEI